MAPPLSRGVEGLRGIRAPVEKVLSAARPAYYPLQRPIHGLVTILAHLPECDWNEPLSPQRADIASQAGVTPITGKPHWMVTTR